MKKLKSIICLVAVFICSSLIFVACGKTTKFKVEFIVDGEEYAVINAVGKESISIPDSPTKDGYEFEGWYFDEGVWQKPFTANSLLSELLNNDLKIYAKWAVNKPKGTAIKLTDFEKVDAKTYTVSLSNKTEVLDMSDVVEVDEKSSWQLVTDIQAKDNIPSKIATLNIGNNTYYVLVTAENGDVKLYTLNIRRRPIYTFTIYYGDVCYEYLDGDTPRRSYSVWESTQEVEEDSCAKQPNIPQRNGYIFNDWDFDFTTQITCNTTIDVSQSWVKDIRSDDHLQYQLSQLNGDICYVVVGCLDNAEQITIPATFNEVPVKEIAEYAFSGCTNVKSIFIPRTINVVWDCAFENSSLEQIYGEFANPVYRWRPYNFDADIQISEGEVIHIPVIYNGAGVSVGAIQYSMPVCRWSNSWMSGCNAQFLWYGDGWKYVNGVPTAGEQYSDEYDWLVYQYLIENYNNLAGSFLNYLNRYYVTNEGREDEIETAWVHLVELYTAVKNYRPTINYADPQFVPGIYRPIIDLLGIDKQVALTMSVAQIKDYLLGMNTSQPVVNLLIDERNEEVNVYRLIDWSVYGSMYEQKLNSVADIYSDTNRADAVSVNINVKQLVYMNGEIISYFLENENNDNFCKYLITEEAQADIKLEGNGYWSYTGISIGNQKYYYQYQGTTPLFNS